MLRKIAPKFKGIVESGQIKVDKHHAEKFAQYKKELEGKEISIVIKRYHKGRSADQNAYYWGVVVKMIGDEIGMTMDEAHDLLRGRFLRRGILYNKKRYWTTLSTRDLDTVGMEDYLTQIRTWASFEFKGMKIPLPNECDFDEWL